MYMCYVLPWFVTLVFVKAVGEISIVYINKGMEYLEYNITYVCIMMK